MTVYGDNPNGLGVGQDVDDILVTDADRVIYAGGGRDQLSGSIDGDSLYGGAGNDLIFGRIVNGGRTGAGTLADPYLMTIPSGLSGADLMFGGSGTDLILGGDGDDFISGEGGNDGGTAQFYGNAYYFAGLFGGDGNDVIHGDEGSDRLSGDAGDDKLFGGTENDTLAGGAGLDRLDGGAGNDVVSYYFEGQLTLALDGSIARTGSALSDILISIEGISGSNTGDDTLVGDSQANTLYGNGGADTLNGKAGRDKLFGGDGNDNLEGGDGNDSLNGGAGADVLSGGAGIDGASYYSGGGVKVSLDGTYAASAQTGDAQGDTFSSIENLSGSRTETDTLVGNGANNTLWGNGAKDFLLGRDGNDILVGGTGADYLDGGTGADRYQYGSTIDAGDFIQTFTAGDLMVFRGGGFGGLAKGALDGSAFLASDGGASTSSAHRFIYESDARTLWYDSDGNGANLRLKIASFAADYAFSTTDFLIV